MHTYYPISFNSFLKDFIKPFIGILFIIFSHIGFAEECKTEIALSGAVAIKNCDPKNQICITGSKAIHEYVNNMKDEPTELSISLQSSPWRLYGPDMRIITIEEISEMAKPSIKNGVKKIVLNASWTGIPPSNSEKSIAQKISASLNNFPVTGMDGFLWLAKDGTTRTTRQAYTVTRGQKPYTIAKGDDVMVALAVGWMVGFEQHFIKERDAEALMKVGAGLDIFALCPDRALELFEMSAKLSNPIAAYNAAIMRLDRQKAGDKEAAIKLLSNAAKLGDEKSLVKLNQLKH